MRRDTIHPDLAGVVVVQNAASIVFTVPASNDGLGTVTPESDLAAQSVRVAYDMRAIVERSSEGDAPALTGTVYAATGANIATGYEFTHSGNHLRITDVIPVPNGIQAKFTGVG